MTLTPDYFLQHESIVLLTQSIPAMLLSVLGFAATLLGTRACEADTAHMLLKPNAPCCSLGHGGEVRRQRGRAPERAARGATAGISGRGHACDPNRGPALHALPGFPGVLPLG